MKKILIVEDDRNMHEIYRDLFIDTGEKYELIYAATVEEAVEQLNAQDIALVVLDIIMEPIVASARVSYISLV